MLEAYATVFSKIIEEARFIFDYYCIVCKPENILDVKEEKVMDIKKNYNEKMNEARRFKKQIEEKFSIKITSKELLEISKTENKTKEIKDMNYLIYNTEQVSKNIYNHYSTIYDKLYDSTF